MSKLILLVIPFLIFSCNKNKLENVEIDKEFSLHAVKRAYYDNNDNRYHQDRFTSDKDGFNFSIDVVAGTEYRIRVYGIPMWDVKLQLKNVGGEVLYTGEQADPSFYSKQITFTAGASEELHIQLIYEADFLYDSDYFLSFEEIGTYSLNWKGYEWICDGDWVITDSDELCHAGHKSGFTKWARINDETFATYETTIYFKGPTSDSSNFVGCILNAATEVRDVHNLPSSGNLFKIQDPNKWEFWQINAAGSVSRELGNSDASILGGLNELVCLVNTDSVHVYLNDIWIYSHANQFSESQSFYLSVEDVQTDPTFFTNVTLE